MINPNNDLYLDPSWEEEINKIDSQVHLQDKLQQILKACKSAEISDYRIIDNRTGEILYDLTDPEYGDFTK